jgi:hypothetical protein
MERFYTYVWEHKPRMTKLEALRERNSECSGGSLPQPPRKRASRGLEPKADRSTDTA